MRKKFLGLIGGLAGLALVLAVPAAGSAAPDGSSSQGAPAGTVAALGPAAECLGFSAVSPQTRVITDDSARTHSTTTWTQLACSRVNVSVPRGRSALIVAQVDGEVSCQGPAGQWCQGRVLIGGVEGEPNAPEPDSFAWATARADLNQWEANGFTRTRRVACSSLSPTACSVSVIAQVRTHAAGMVMRVDDRTLHAQLSL